MKEKRNGQQLEQRIADQRVEMDEIRQQVRVQQQQHHACTLTVRQLEVQMGLLCGECERLEYCAPYDGRIIIIITIIII